MRNTHLGNLMGTIGIAYGIFHGIKKSQKIGEIAIYSVLFGVAGVLVGNSVSKFYE
jgi:hypothetical protein